MSSLLNAITASASGLDAQRARMEVAVSNLANADSTRSANGEPYRRRQIVLEATSPAGSMPGDIQPAGVRVAAVLEDQSPFQRRFDPTSVDADEQGYVATPNVEVPEEMVDMLGAARAYQANLTAIGLIRDTIAKALELAK